jgi:hypothetical protein
MKPQVVVLLFFVAMSKPIFGAPPAPTNVVATDGTLAGKIRVTWNTSAWALAYEVWRGTSSNSRSASKVATQFFASFEDKSVNPGTTYYYWVNAKNLSGTSGFSVFDTGYRIGVTIKEQGSTYGYDNHTDPQHPWKSVETGKTDTVRTEIVPSSAYKSVSFTSASSSKVSVSPSTPTSSNQVLTNQGGTTRATAKISVSISDGNLAQYSAAAYKKIQKTVAIILVHEKDTDGSGPNRGYTSIDIADSLITSELRGAYKQAVVEWKVVRRPTCTVEFDLNNDGRIDVGVWMSAEMQKIRDACKSDEAYNVFLVSKPTRSSTGVMQFNQKYGFVHADTGGAQTVAHELGHGAASLTHTPSDEANVMYNFFSPSAWRFRKNQWDRLNP